MDACWRSASGGRLREAAAHVARLMAGPRTMPVITCCSESEAPENDLLTDAGKVGGSRRCVKKERR